jgi:hypothetical protein
MRGLEGFPVTRALFLLASFFCTLNFFFCVQFAKKTVRKKKKLSVHDFISQMKGAREASDSKREMHTKSFQAPSTGLSLVPIH